MFKSFSRQFFIHFQHNFCYENHTDFFSFLHKLDFYLGLYTKYYSFTCWKHIHRYDGIIMYIENLSTAKKIFEFVMCVCDKEHFDTSEDASEYNAFFCLETELKTHKFRHNVIFLH